MRRIARFVLAATALVGVVALGGVAYAYPALVANGGRDGVMRPLETVAGGATFAPENGRGG